MSTTVLITARSFQKLQGAHWDILHQAGYETITSGVDHPLTAGELAERLSGIEAVITGMDVVSEQALDAADRLRVISMNGTGIDRIDVAAATRRGIAVTNTPGSNADSVADHTLALILAQARLLPAHDRRVRAGEWRRVPGHELGGRRLGLVGLGRIGKGVALRARGFGLIVQATDPYIDRDYCSANGIDVVDWQTILATSDILSLHLPATGETHNLIDQTTLAAMKPGAVLINTARGDLVDEAALVEALVSGHLAGAGLDVFAPEPPERSALWDMDQVILSPHLGSNTLEATLRTARQSAQNVVDVLAGRTPASIVNPDVLR